MWRYLAGAAAALLMVVAGLLLGRGIAGNDSPAAAAAGAGDALAPAMAFGDLPEPPRASDLSKEEKRFNRYDKDKNGGVSREEYLANRRKAFERLDKDGNGQLSFDEYGIKTIDKFAKADRNRNGALDRPEFSTTRVIRKAQPRCECSKPAPRKAEEPAVSSEDE